MLKSGSKLAVALSVLTIAACAQTGFETKSAAAATPTAAEMTAATEAPAGWRPFSADSPWNTKIRADAKIDHNSDVLLSGLSNGNPLYINMDEWTVTVRYFDSALAPKRSVRPIFPNRYGPGVEPKQRVPLPDDAVTPDAPQAQEFYISLVDLKLNKSWDYRQLARNERGEWSAGFGAEVDLAGTGVAPPWMVAARPDASAGPRPSGIPLMAGLIRAEEIKAGKIDHALAFAYNVPRGGIFVSPASTALDSKPGQEDNVFGLPMGARIQLDPQYDIENTLLSPGAKVVARALQEYGMILVDYAGATTLFAEKSPENPDQWSGVLAPSDLQLLFTPEFMTANFRVLELSDKMPGVPVLQAP